MNIHSIETGFFSTEGAAMFGLVSQKVWTRMYPTDESNRCPLAMRVLFLDMGERKVLFDTGVGTQTGSDAAYYRFRDLTILEVELEKLGVKPEEVTDVVFSHLHFDHCGGAVRENDQGKLVPRFPRAVYWASQRQVDLTFKPSLWEADSYAPNVLKALMDAGQLRLVEGSGVLFPGVRVKLVSGHTEGQLLSYLDSSIGTVVYVGDVLPMTPHILPLCIAAVDNCAQLSVDEKMLVLEEAVEDDQVLFFFHDTQTVAARLKKKNGRISLKEKLLF